MYAVVAVTVLSVLGPGGVAALARAAGGRARGQQLGLGRPVVRVGGARAALGALLALIAGIGRTSLAMAREGDLPRWLAAVHPRFRVPHHAEVALAVVVCTLVLTVDLRGASGSRPSGSCSTTSSPTCPPSPRTATTAGFRRALQVLGAGGCIVLVVTLPDPAVVAGLAVFAVGIAYRLLRLHRGQLPRGRQPPSSA